MPVSVRFFGVFRTVSVPVAVPLPSRYRPHVPRSRARVRTFARNASPRPRFRPEFVSLKTQQPNREGLTLLPSIDCLNIV